MKTESIFVKLMICLCKNVGCSKTIQEVLWLQPRPIRPRFFFVLGFGNFLTVIIDMISGPASFNLVLGLFYKKLHFIIQVYKKIVCFSKFSSYLCKALYAQIIKKNINLKK